MKKSLNRLIILTLLPALCLLLSCEKEIMKYEGKEGVYFAVQSGGLPVSAWPYQPYTVVPFFQINQPEVLLPIKIMITGPVKNYDRVFRLEVNPDSTTAVLGLHYEALQSEWTIPANAITTNIQIRLKRTADLQTKTVKLGLRLVATKDFELSFPEWDAIPGLTAGTVVPEFDASLHRLDINDFPVTPFVWVGSLQPGNRESGLFGVFTREKMEFLSENLGLKYEDFASSATMPAARYNLVAADAAAILIKRLNEKNPVLEEDGRLMFIGSVPWTTIIGVPYVPAP